MHSNHKDNHRTWLLPSPKKSVGGLTAGLYLVSTPIGNLGDITIRALDTLTSVDLIVSEDTRVTRKLLNYYNIKNRIICYNDHSAATERQSIVDRINAGESVALVSDAGTPLVSDPGYKLVQACIQADIFITPVPGANAPLSALQLSGLPSNSFAFLGFVPTKNQSRAKFLEAWETVNTTLIVFERAGRLLETLRSIRTCLGERELAVVREMTKLYEETQRGSVDTLISYYEDNGLPKGEIVIAIGPPTTKIYDESSLRDMMKNALKTMTTKEAASHLAEKTGQPRKKLYQLALHVKTI